MFLVGVNWSALTDANRPSTRMALGMVRRRSGIWRYDDLREYGSRRRRAARASARVSSRGARRRRAARARVWVCRPAAA